jgi:hypothetical protein
LYGMDYNEETGDWAGSRFPAAGEMARVFDTAGNEPPGDPKHDAVGFVFWGDGDNAVAGDWFILDYNAITVGVCSIVFYDNSIDWDYPVYQIFFTQVKTRDFDDDGIVNFKDFTILGLNWRRTYCTAPENCSGTDLDENGKVDLNDLALFADFWLERTR